jgi:hypothetical protein
MPWLTFQMYLREAGRQAEEKQQAEQAVIDRQKLKNALGE